MWVVLFLVAAVGATSPTKSKCLMPTGPYKEPNCGAHASFVMCPPNCPRTQNCSNLWSKFPCEDDGCCYPACRCDEGYMRDDQTGLCVTVQECMNKPNRPCTPNENKVQCPITCPPQACDASYVSYLCAQKDESVPCDPGCNCKDGYLRDTQGLCIPEKECPPLNPIRCGANEERKDCRTICPPQNCDIAYTDYACNKTLPCEPGCDCIKDYLRDGNGVCVLNEKCPPPPTIKPPVEENTSPTKPTKSISSSSSSSSSTAYSKSSSSYSKSSSYSSASSSTSTRNKGKPKAEPQKCGVNEEWVPCRSICPPQSCAISYTSYLCEPPPPCEPGCDCIKDHLRDDNGVCILNDKCPPPPVVTESPVTESPEKPCGANETEVNCKVECPNSYCPVNDNRGILICDPPKPCPSGCICSLGYRRKSYEDRSCILAEECPPVNCTRQNEEWNSCPSCLAEDCADINNQPSVCNELVHNCYPKCVCKKGFFRNGTDNCIPASECPPTVEVTTLPPEASQCSVNETYVPCTFGCPTNNCPTSDTRAIVACSPPYPCKPGCACKIGYRKKSYADRSCILGEECPPVNCTRPHEKWNSCPSPCLSERCGDQYNPPVACNELIKNCRPKCVCEDGYYRNENDICVPANECPPVPCTRPNEKWDPCTSSCLAESCTDYLNPPGVCNEFVQNCQPKCVCEEGFYRNESQICVPAKECGAKQCGANETYSECTFGCPHDFCPADDDQGIYACKPPRDCPSGCRCKLNYRWKSYDDRTCVLARDCKEVTCTRPNEEWNACTTSCLAESCQDYLNPPGACSELIENCQPKCVCQKGFYRNSTGDCVPAKQCVKKKET